MGVVAGMEECGGSIKIRGEGRSGAGDMRGRECLEQTGLASRLQAGNRFYTAKAAALP